ncbi:hypothetical protein NC653_014456, partial [Populus alba x Populus x berolinensis]
MHYWTLGRTPRKPHYLMAPEIPLVLLPVSLKLSSLHVLQMLDKLCMVTRRMNVGFTNSGPLSFTSLSVESFAFVKWCR